MKIIHVQSVVNTIFGVLDDNDNVVAKQPVNIELTGLNEAAVKEALDKLLLAKDDLVKQLSQKVN